MKEQTPAVDPLKETRRAIGVALARAFVADLRRHPPQATKRNELKVVKVKP